MRKSSILFAFACLLGGLLQSCNNDKTYAEMKEDERKAIQRFIDKEDIEVISFSQFQNQDSTTDVSKNEFVLFSESGVYMQIIERGSGDELEDGRHEILVRYIEKKINEDGSVDTLSANNLGYAYPDEMMVTKSGKSYSATFTSAGEMYQTYQTTYVPTGWLVPFNYIQMGRTISERSKLRLIVPHSEGQSDASAYVYPCYYEITYQLAR